MTDQAGTGDSASGASLGAAVRARRELLGLSQSDLALALDCPVTDVVGIEDGTARFSSHKVFELAAVLHTDVDQLIGSTSRGERDAAVRALDRLGRTWRLWDEAAAAALALADWYSVDSRLTLQAAPSTHAGPNTLAGRGVPDAVAPAIPRRQMPCPHAPAEQVTHGNPWAALAGRAAQLARQLRATAGIDSGPHTATELAAAFGIPMGRRPLPEHVKAVAGYADRRPLLILNSDRADDVTEHSALHLIAHLVCGDITLAALDYIPDRRSDSLHTCLGTSRDACLRAQHVAGWLGDGDELTARREADIAAVAATPYVAPRPLFPPDDATTDGAGPGPESEGHREKAWFDYDVDIPYVDIDEYLPYRHPDLRGRGCGDTVFPAALTRRYLTVLRAGVMINVDRIDELGIGEWDYPTRSDLADALRGHRTVEAQLEAWNADQSRSAFDR